MVKNKQSPSISWKKVHVYCFGYYKWPSVFAVILLVIISLTGILYNHQHDFDFLEKGRISTDLLPDHYQKRLDRTREAQGLQDLFPEEADKIPVMWLIKDLHTGDFWGPWGRLLYDLLCISLLTLSITGCYLFLKMRIRIEKKNKWRRK